VLLQRILKLKEPIPASGKGKRANHVYWIAAEIMCQKGYEGTSMSDIAEAAGLTKAGIYHYIRGKEELLGLLIGANRASTTGVKTRWGK
jgi:hypothetical protein